MPITEGSDVLATQSEVSAPGVRQVSANDTLQPGDSIVQATAACTLNLSGSAVVGKKYDFKNSSTGVFTLAAQSGSAIDGAANFPLAAKESATLSFDGTNWMVL